MKEFISFPFRKTLQFPLMFDISLLLALPLSSCLYSLLLSTYLALYAPIWPSSLKYTLWSGATTVTFSSFDTFSAKELSPSPVLHECKIMVISSFSCLLFHTVLYSDNNFSNCCGVSTFCFLPSIVTVILFGEPCANMWIAPSSLYFSAPEIIVLSFF